MSNLRKKVGKELRERLTRESFAEGCIVSQLAESHGISKKTVYGWRRQYKQKELSIAGSRFVELAVQEAPPQLLKKAELIFQDFSVLLEGRVNINKLSDIIKILGTPC